MDKPLHKEKINGYILKIYQDTEPESPREWDNLGTIYHAHSGYDLGIRLPIEEIKAIYKDKNNIALPVYLFDHSGLRISTKAFNCPWDSGQVGIISVSIEKVKKEYKIKKITKKVREKVINGLREEVKTFYQYLSGDIYGFIIEREKQCDTCHNKENEHIDSCWGYYGFDNCLIEAKSNVPKK